MPQILSGGRGHYDSAARRIVPEFTGPSTWAPLKYALAPADLATQYDLAPLYSAGVTGTGVTIGIINESNIDLSQAAAYRSVFGLSPNAVQVVIDGEDPGRNASATEAYLDVETAGAMAPAATVYLYIAAGASFQDPLLLAAMRAIEDNQADVLSVSYGASEIAMGPDGNQLWNALWEQAAAQGQTVLVASGDFGQAPDPFFELGVNGLASTAWNVAVGGTDFYYSDYATGAASADSAWNAANDPTTKGSLKASLPEQVWNDPFGLDAISDGLKRGEIYAGGGGASGCLTVNQAGTCGTGYPKPAWQTGPGVPADGVRDLPDISLFASNGANYSAYAICGYEGACAPDANGNFGVDLVGGTSASTPAMAGIMALVNQKYGRQGQANYVLYPLSQQKPSAFRDITTGGNWDLCQSFDPNCNVGVDNLGQYWGESTVYAAAPGFDLASGLGSIDAANLVNNWNTVSFRGTATTLQVSPAKITHGSNVTVTAAVTPASGTGAPSGAVAILANSVLPSGQGLTQVSLSAGTGSATLNSLPGGKYQLTAKYGGDGVFGGSTSSPVALTVSPEASNLTLTIQGENASLSNLSYGMPVSLNAQPVGVSAAQGKTDGAATGAITFTLDSTTINVPLNTGGVASWNGPALAVGTHTAGASYTGDASFQASSAPPQTFNIPKGVPFILLYPSLPLGPVPVGTNISVAPGSSLTMSVEVASFNSPSISGQSAPLGLAAPTGTVTVSLFIYGTGGWSIPYAQTATLKSPGGIYSTAASALVTFPNLAVGDYYFVASYSGDANWAGNTCLTPLSCGGGLYFIDVATPAATPAASTTNLTITPSSISAGQGATLTATVTGAAGSTVAPSGRVSFYDNGAPVGFGYYTEQLAPAASGASASFSYTLSPDYFWTNGANQITAVYSGDANYLGSTSNTVSLSVAQTGTDFVMTPQLPQLSVASGSSGSIGINLTSLYGFSGTVALSCVPSSKAFGYSVNPASPTLSGSTQATLTITATTGSGATAAVDRQIGRLSSRHQWFGPASGALLVFAALFFVPVWRRRWRLPALFLILTFMFAGAGCGGGGGGSQTGPPSNPNYTPPGVYSVVVTGTANGVVHNVRLNVVVTAQ